MTRIRAAVAVLLALCVGALLLLSRPSRAVPENLLVIVIDTWRADYFSEERSPALHQIFSSWGRSYPQAWSVASWTMPSVATMFTGKTGLAHVPYLSLDAEHLTFAELARSEGLQTALFSENTILRVGEDGIYEGLGYEQGFDTSEIVGRPLLDPSRSWLDEQAGNGPWFLWLQLMDVHDYRGSEERVGLSYQELEQLLDRCADGEFSTTEECEEAARLIPEAYAGAVADLSQRLGVWLAGLNEAGHLDNTMVVLTSDHGEGLGELDPRGAGVRRAGHGGGLWEESTRIPWLVAGPGIPNGTDEAPISLADFYGATAQHMGWQVPEGIPPWRGYLDASTPDRALPLRGCLFIDRPTTGVIRYPEKVVVEEGREAGWALQPGFGEQLGSVSASLRTLLPGEPSCDAVDAELEARLAALGYVVSEPSKEEDPSEAHQRDDYTEE